MERLRNIRDMFESSANREDDEELNLQKVERVEPSEKIKEKLNRFVSL